MIIRFLTVFSRIIFYFIYKNFLLSIFLLIFVMFKIKTRYYMSTFDLSKAIEYFGLSTDNVAKLLFPSAKYPKMALARILKGEADLDLNQLYSLASYLGITVSDLLVQDNWKGISENGHLVFIKGQYKAKVNYNGAFLTLYEGDNVIMQEAGNISTMTISDFINHINKLITIKGKKHGNN